MGCQLKEEQQHETVNLEKMKKDLNIVRNGLQVRSFYGTVTPDFFRALFDEQGLAYSPPLDFHFYYQEVPSILYGTYNFRRGQYEN